MTEACGRYSVSTSKLLLAATTEGHLSEHDHCWAVGDTLGGAVLVGAVRWVHTVHVRTGRVTRGGVCDRPWAELDLLGVITGRTLRKRQVTKQCGIF